jgi:hypothetical protein
MTAAAARDFGATRSGKSLRDATTSGAGITPFSVQNRGLGSACLGSAGLPAKMASCGVAERLVSGVGSIHKLCVTAVDEDRAVPFHVKRYRWIMDCAPNYPQGVQAFYVAFHVKRRGLWITSVDNFWCAVVPTDGDELLRWLVCLNG